MIFVARNIMLLRISSGKHMVAGLCHFDFSRRKDTTRKYEKTPSENTKKCHAKMRKITQCEKTKPATRKDEISEQKDNKKPCEKTPFETLNLSFCAASLRLFFFSHSIFSSLRPASFRPFTLRFFVFSPRKRQKDIDIRYITCIIRRKSQ